MATITNFNVTVNTMCTPEDKNCFLAYSYTPVWGEDDAKEEKFNVHAQAFAGDKLHHESLFSTPESDHHEISRKTLMPVVRTIPVPCNRLEGFWGDSLILKLVVEPESGNGKSYEAITSTEMEYESAA